eukprot:COSAG06_NODE_7386_length_2522_cov_1.635163_2_plen_195_part_00
MCGYARLGCLSYDKLIIQARVRTMRCCCHVVTVTTASPARCACGRFRLPLHLHPPGGSLGANIKRSFCGAIYIVLFKTIILPRQTRDTHKETLQKREWRFAQEGHSFQSIRDRCKATLSKAAEGSSVCSREQWHEEQLTFTEVEFEWCAHRQAGRQAGRFCRRQSCGRLLPAASSHVCAFVCVCVQDPSVLCAR